MSAGQQVVQVQFQDFVFQPTNQEQIMQIAVFVVMFVGAAAFYLWNIKPFLALFSQASAAQNVANCHIGRFDQCSHNE